MSNLSFSKAICSDQNGQLKKTISPDGATRFFYQNDTGDAEMVFYEVFPGIKLVYRSVHMAICPDDREEKGNFIEIYHCREGRIERQFDNDFFYLAPGDLAVVRTTRLTNQYGFPLGHYHGISIMIDEAKVPKCFSCFLEDVKVNPVAVADRLCKDSRCFVVRSEDYIKHLFSELYSVPDSYRKGYLKIKILELLLVRSGAEPENLDRGGLPLPRTQVELAKQISAYLTEHMDQHITAEELSKQFHLSQTHLRNIFKGVYGVPIYSYMRIQKMQLAATQLIHTTMSVLEIANACGYTNASKFAAAFREVMGETPVDYRSVHAISR